MNEKTKRNSASFRDPVATVFVETGRLTRVINRCYFREYDHFMKGLYPELIRKGLIIPHREISRDENTLVIEPEYIPFISYPYEWSFDMLKEAALVTLRINRIAMKYGMMLKDATAYNIQYYKGRMILIDTTSFMFYSGNMPWPSYTQFLRHFVDPLLWIRYFNQSMGRLMETNLDGIPVPLTNRMLPVLSRFNVGITIHIFSQSLAGMFKAPSSKQVTMNSMSLESLLSSLYNFTRKLKYKPKGPRGKGWLEYSEAGSYSSEALAHKQKIVSGFLNPCSTVLDLGSNTGEYSRIARAFAPQIVSVDADHDCIHSLYNTPGILPLVVDLCNPSPGIGWANRERLSFWERVGEVDTIMALALIHHLSVSNNVPLDMVADLLSKHCKTLIIEWVPPEDKQAQKLLGNKNIPEYSHEAFIKAFNQRFEQFREVPISCSGRIIYKMTAKKGNS